MKKIVFLLAAIGLFLTACNNNKSAKKTDTNQRATDDYSKGDKPEIPENNGNKNDFNPNKDDAGQTGNWSASDVKEFNAQCLKTLNNNEEVARTFCPCFLEKFQQKYSSLADMDKNSTYEEGKIAGEECRAQIEGDKTPTTVSGGWPQSERDGFVTNCVENAMKGGRSRAVAESYCGCMLNKIENLYPDIKEAGKLTEDDMNSPAMKKMMKDCLDNN